MDVLGHGLEGGIKGDKLMRGAVWRGWKETRGKEEGERWGVDGAKRARGSSDGEGKDGETEVAVTR